MRTYQQPSQPAVQPGPATAQMYAQQPAPLVYQPYPNMNYYNPPPKEDPSVACMWVQYLIGMVGSVVLYICFQVEFHWLAYKAYTRAYRIRLPESAQYDPMGIVYNVVNDDTVISYRDAIITRLLTFFACTFVFYLIFAIVVWNGQCCSFGGCGCSGMSTSARVPKILFQITGYLLILSTIAAVGSLIAAIPIAVTVSFN